MTISIEDYKNNLRNVVRPNRFLCSVTPPPAGDLYVPDGDMITFHVTQCNIPDRQFSQAEIKYFGMSFFVPGGEVITDLSMTIINDSAWELRDFFEEWANLINDRNTNKKAYLRDLIDGAEIFVKQLGFDGETLAGYKFCHIFPKYVHEIELSMDNGDQVETFQVTFAYSYWEQWEVEDEE